MIILIQSIFCDQIEIVVKEEENKQKQQSFSPKRILFSSFVNIYSALIYGLSMNFNVKLLSEKKAKKRNCY